ncbi:MAG: methionyl-tRNA formyltransferase [Parachlamydiales bacterium]|jgi:methionyl-tRNA formyltransferase
MRMVFFGTSLFASELLSFLVENNLKFQAVVTQPDKVKNHLHVSEVKNFCQKLASGLPLLQPEKASDKLFVDEIRSLKPDLFIVAAYGQILSQELLSVPSKGAINVHASLLPKYRGAAPMQRALMAGEKFSGITIMQMNAKMDEGDILEQSAVPVSGDMTLSDLEELFIRLAKSLLLKVIRQVEKGTLQPKAQDHEAASWAPKIRPEEYWLDWRNPAEKLHNQVRALSPQPAARAKIRLNGEEKLLKILLSKVAVLPEKMEKAAPKEVLKLDKNKLTVACGTGALDLQLVQLEGKRPLAAADFLRGLKSQIFFI